MVLQTLSKRVEPAGNTQQDSAEESDSGFTSSHNKYLLGQMPHEEKPWIESHTEIDMDPQKRDNYANNYNTM